MNRGGYGRGTTFSSNAWKGVKLRAGGVPQAATPTLGSLSGLRGAVRKRRGLQAPPVIQRSGMQRHAPAGVWAAVWFAVLARGWVIFFKSTC